MEGNNITIDTLRKIIQELRGYNNIQSLMLSGPSTGLEDSIEFANEDTRSRFNHHVQELSSAIRNNNTIDSIDMNSTFIKYLDENSKQALFEAIGSRTTLISIKLTVAYKVKIPFSFLTSALFPSQQTTDLSMAVSPFPSILVASPAPSPCHSPLVSITIDQAEIVGTNAEFQSFLNALHGCKNLRNVHFCGVDFPSDINAALLINSLSNLPNLEELHLSEFQNKIPLLVEGRSDMVKPSLLLSELKNITTVSINTFEEFTYNKLVDFSAALTCHRTLEKLDLNSCDLTDRGGVLIANALCGNKHLKELLLDDTGIGHQSGMALSLALEENDALQVLSLEDNMLGEESLISIANSMQHNRALTRLVLSFVTFRGYEAISDAMQFNQVLKELIILCDEEAVIMDNYNLNTVNKKLKKSLEKNFSLLYIMTNYDGVVDIDVQFYLNLNMEGKRQKYLRQHEGSKSEYIENCLLPARRDLQQLFYWIQANPSLLF